MGNVVEERKAVLGNWKANRILYFCTFAFVVFTVVIVVVAVVAVVGVVADIARAVCIYVVQQMMCRPIRQAIKMKLRPRGH